MSKKHTEYATIQIDRKIKEQVSDYCNRKGLKIGRFMEMVFLHVVSGSRDENRDAMSPLFDFQKEKEK